MGTPYLIGLTGLAGAGKSTIAQALIDEHNCARVKFATALKDMLAQLPNITPAMLECPTCKETPLEQFNGATPRQLMQTLGTDWGRAIDPDFWVKQTLPLIKQYMSLGISVVVDDVRFENEAQAIYALGGLVISLTRDGVEPTGHISETGIASLPISATVENTTIYDTLYRLVEIIRKHYA